MIHEYDLRNDERSASSTTSRLRQLTAVRSEQLEKLEFVAQCELHRRYVQSAAQSDTKGTQAPPLTLPIGHQPLTPSYVVGCFITGLALTLGAPFWFDLLGRLVNLRQSGVPPDLKSKVVAQ
jgi:hypothetical protein